MKGSSTNYLIFREPTGILAPAGKVLKRGREYAREKREGVRIWRRKNHNKAESERDFQLSPCT